MTHLNAMKTHPIVPESGSGNTETADPQLATKREIARRYAVSTRTVDNWIASRLIPVLRFGPRLVRFPVREVDRVLSERFKINPR